METQLKAVDQPVKLLQLTALGEAGEVVKIHKGHISTINADEVLVAMEAAPIHISDILMITGRYGIKPSFPAVLGAEGIGRVIAIGSSVNSEWHGKRVVILPYYEQGTWASHIVLPLKNIVQVSESADATQLAQMTINAMTAYLSLREYAKLMPGDWIGQTAANSAVGQYVIGFAKMAGMKTLNIVRRKEAGEFVSGLGGDAVVVIGEYLEEQIEKILDGKQLSLVLDTVGGQLVGQIAKFLKSRSAIVGYSSESGQTPAIAPFDLFYRRLSYHGFWVIDWFKTTPKTEIDTVIYQLNEMLDTGKLSATVGGTYSIDQYKEAFASAMKGGRPGKIFFTFNQSTL
ncbi:zinc-dependent alcohol dehydrogenase family protein [Pedobacter sandarakinus]|uniref:zinc-dependent alcohol dehydrogenase family protein n=1 Tax=Pedobacter sandarakinus TaxID=353156 RepID=UPI00224786B5|nr:zinc-dependent alcohol dehydrogenase family protein [Pedobacter sandarakinus]MCX2574056.1 zinc-dependent alcohol dehydrogenase family protein [Pedobacter sandarakinus]